MYESKRDVIHCFLRVSIATWDFDLLSFNWPTVEWSTLNRQETLHIIQDLAARVLVIPFLLWWCTAPATAMDQLCSNTTLQASLRVKGRLISLTMKMKTLSLAFQWTPSVLALGSSEWASFTPLARSSCRISYWISFRLLHHFWARKLAPPRTLDKSSRTRTAFSTVSAE